MKWVCFGDLHINQPMQNIRLVSNRFKSVEEAYAYSHLLYISEIVEKINVKNANICFLGDITHYNQDKFDLFVPIVERIKELRPNWNVHIIIGNHDTSGSYKLENAKILKLQDVYNNMIIHHQPDFVSSNNVDVLFLPYIKRELIVPTVRSFSGNRPTLILSHNYIHTTDHFGRWEMIPFSQLKAINRNIILINGHIHRWYNEPGYYQIGSAAPTSFKEYLNATGCAVFDDIDLSVKLFKNTWMFFLSVNKTYYQRELEDFLFKADIHGSIVFVNNRGNIDIDFSKHKSIIGFRIEKQ